MLGLFVALGVVAVGVLHAAVTLAVDRIVDRRLAREERARRVRREIRRLATELNRDWVAELYARHTPCRELVTRSGTG